jgi:hypothetical protein
MTTETSGRLGLAAPEAPPGLAECLRGGPPGVENSPEGVKKAVWGFLCRASPNCPGTHEPARNILNFGLE